MMSLKTKPNVWPRNPILNSTNRVKRLYCSIAIAPITGEIPVRTALNDRASLRYSRIIINLRRKTSSIKTHRNIHMKKNLSMAYLE